MTRAEWLTVENLKKYYETVEGVLLKAGVAEQQQEWQMPCREWDIQMLMQK